MGPSPGRRDDGSALINVVPAAGLTPAPDSDKARNDFPIKQN